MADVVPISPVALHERVVAQLRTLLIEGRIAPGAKLNERELSAQLQVSRTPLREAIKLLAAEGLVDLLPNRGAVAVRLTEADVTHSFEVLAALEGMAGQLAAERITEAALAEIAAMHYEMKAAFMRRDLSRYYRLNARIHGALNEAAGNPVLAQTYRTINARVQAMRFHSNQDHAKWKHAMREHDRMLEALSARDGEALREVLVQHLVRKRDTVLALLRTGELYPAQA